MFKQFLNNAPLFRCLFWNTGKYWINPLGANPIKWSNTLKKFVGTETKINEI